MPQETQIQFFENAKIRVVWDEEKEEYFFSIVDVISVLTVSADAAAYWRKLKQRLKAEGNETVTSCHTLKMSASDGKMRLTQQLTAEYGSGYDCSSLYKYIRFYQCFPNILDAASPQSFLLTWTHYRTLLQSPLLTNRNTNQSNIAMV
jgi:hypothetical protein